MKPVYTDIHIHTSENADQIVSSYDYDMLIDNVQKKALGKSILISLTDHNTINKKAYLGIKKDYPNVCLLLGVELHISKDESAEPYHCHMIFNSSINETDIDKINVILDRLYPHKMVVFGEDRIHNIEVITTEFDEYEYIMLPHGGQSHRTFDKSIVKGKSFDTTLERSIYYNQFDGFTSRSNKGIEDTILYFAKLGVNEFINLVTCSDNYNPNIYPNTKVKTKEEFVPTWMYAEPTFAGLRLSLSESTRLFYGKEPKENFSEYIQGVFIKNDKLDIDINLTQGLNVIIGGSSSGKTMLADILYCGISQNFEHSKYKKFNINAAEIEYKAKMIPHYINQNFIVNILQDKEKNIGDIDIIKNVFPEDDDVNQHIRTNMSSLKKLLETLLDSVNKIETQIKKFEKIPTISRLIVMGKVDNSILKSFEVKLESFEKLKISKVKYDEYIKSLDELHLFLINNELVNSCESEILKIKSELDSAKKISEKNIQIKELIDKHLRQEDSRITDKNRENAQKIRDKKTLINTIKDYINSHNIFSETIRQLSNYDVSYETRNIDVNGHKLSIENNFKISEATLINAINDHLKLNFKIQKLSELTPERLFKERFSDRPKVKNYNDFVKKVYDRICEVNKLEYKIVTNDNRNFESLSPGWKSAILLDLVLGYNLDRAPIIIDQPEDNLATDYINRQLISIIKKVKGEKQIVLVSHNATIPILGDAQNIIVCHNNDGNIRIRSACLEGMIDGKPTLEYVAEITDGGKPAIKKRVKKYNMKSFREV